MNVFIVVLHFGDILVTKACIASLYKNETYPFTLIVVNNTEKTYTAKDFTKKKTTLLNNKKNLGFAGGVNVGIRFSLKQKADAICLLNNDTHIQKPILEKLSKELHEKSVGIVGPAIRFKKNKKVLFDVGGKVNKLTLRTSHTEVKKITDIRLQRAEYISGCCMLVKKEVFKKSGLFDDRFFLYYEDADFCLRAKEKGFTTACVPSVVIDHELSKSAGKMSSLAIYYLTQSSILFGKKYAKNSVQRVANKLFIFVQSILFFKANPRSGISLIKALLQA